MQTPHAFTQLLERLGRAQPPSLAYEPGADCAAWQARFRQALDCLRSPLPERPEPRVERVAQVEADDHVRQRLEIRVSDYSTLPANLLLPKADAPAGGRPGLLVLHGHESDIDAISGACDLDEGEKGRRAYALSAVRAGYAVLAPSLWGWEGRDGHVERIGRRDKCNVIQMAAAMYGVNVVDLHLQDLQASLDVLADLPGVDAARVGCLGNSTGGRMTMWLSIFDGRVKACVASGSMNTFRERSLKLASCGLQYPFGLLRLGDVAELFCLIAPRPMQLQAGARDSLITPADRDAMYETVRHAYGALGAAGALDYVLHPEGHILLWERAQAFFARHL